MSNEFFFQRNVTFFNARGVWDSTEQYEVYDGVTFVVSGQNVGFIAFSRPTPGVLPTAANSGWGAVAASLITGPIGPQGLPAPDPQVQYSSDGSTYQNSYTDGDEYRRVSYDGGTNWVVERIRGDKGEKGDAGIGRDGRDGVDAPLLRWQYAAQPTDPNDPITWRDNYVEGDVWKHYSANNGVTWGVPERILGRDGRDGFDVERQFAASEDGPWEVEDSGQDYVRDRVGDIAPFGPPVRRSVGGSGGSGTGWAIAATAPTTPTPTDGKGWYDTVNDLLKIYDGSAWKPAVPAGWVTSATAPTTPAPIEGTGWYDSAKNVLKIYDGSHWNVASGYDHALFPDADAALDDYLDIVDVSDENMPKKDTIRDILALGGFATKKSLFSVDKFWSINQNARVAAVGEWAFLNASNAVVSLADNALTPTEVASIRYIEIHEDVFRSSDYLNAIANSDNSTGFTQLQNDGGILYIHDTDASSYATIETDYFTVTITSSGSTKTGSVYKFACTVTQTGSVWNGGQWYAIDFDVVSGQLIQAQQLRDVQTLFAKAISVQNTDKLLTMDGNGVLGNIKVDTLLSRLVEIADLIGDDTADFYGDFQSAAAFLPAQTTNKRGSWSIATGTGVPDPANFLNYNAIGDGNYILIFGATMQTSDWKFRSAAFAASQFETGDTLYIHPYDPYDKDNYFKATLTGNATLVGTGNAAYLYMPVTIDEVGNVVDPSDGWRISETPPTSILAGLRGRLPTGVSKTDADIDSASKLLLDNFDDLAIGELIEWINDHHTGLQTVTGYTYVTTNLTLQSPAGQVSEASGIVYIKPLNDTDKASLKAKLVVGKVVRFWISSERYKQMKLSSTWSDALGYLSANVTDVTDVGDALTNNHAVSLQFESNIPARDEFTDLAFIDIDDLVAETTPADDDEIAMWDTSANKLRKIRLVDLKTFINA